MDPAEQQALINFLGTAYGERKQIDSNIVSRTSFLNEGADNIRQVVEQTLSQMGAPVPSGAPISPPSSIPETNEDATLQSAQIVAQAMAEINAAATMSDHNALPSTSPITPEVSLTPAPQYIAEQFNSPTILPGPFRSTSFEDEVLKKLDVIIRLLDPSNE